MNLNKIMISVLYLEMIKMFDTSKIIYLCIASSVGRMVIMPNGVLRNLMMKNPNVYSVWENTIRIIARVLFALNATWLDIELKIVDLSISPILFDANYADRRDIRCVIVV